MMGKGFVSDVLLEGGTHIKDISRQGGRGLKS